MLTQARVGRFEIRDFLGRGAIGDVYLAWDPKLASEVALKLVRTAKTDPEMVAAERNGTLLQDALAQVAPQVAAVYEQGDQDGFFWVAMEYVAGTDLAQVIEREAPFDEQRAVNIALQLCEMLEMFHELTTEGRRGIVHGDLKPENIRIQEGDRVRVLDFGIAKHLSQTRRFTHNLFGSLPYTPPERLNSGRLDAQSDLWAVGVILYLMVAAYPPWSGQDPEELERRIRHGEPPIPLPEGVSPGLKKILYRALAFNPERRYASAGALRADLEAWRDGRPVPEPEEEPARDDLNATRRTSRPLDDSRAGETRRTDRPIPAGLDATRRTYEPGVAIPPAPPPPLADQLASVPGPQPDEPAKPKRRKRKWLALAGALLIAFGASQFWIQGEAQELQRALVTDTDPDLLAILQNYRKVSWLGIFNPSMGKVRDELREALVTSADRLIDGYHGDYPSTRERGWQTAYEYLQGAVELNYLDRKVRAKMYYAKAHLDRIESQTLKQRGERAAASQKVDAAISSFREAARRDKDWPDPYLGLARVHAYERPDLDELQKSLVELEKRGYHLGKRERTMEADGYRMRADELWARAQKARGTDAETELLEKTRDNLLQAINFYDDAAGYADVKTNRARAHDRLDQVQTRLRVLETPGFLDELFGITVEQGRQGPDG
ncbi:MAG: eukaryotic-like serine/threonine-protein kinase [Acidobacteriota bacterium]|jgi:serine/threonine protein kinase|nr:eukaryotic-like serine/threonine-protein kinase [Acidobacteriota bacterium]